MNLIATALLVVSAAFTAGCATPPDARAPLPDVTREAPSVAPAPRAATAPSLALGANETAVARYTTLSAQPLEEDGNPLAVIAKVHFPRQVVNTVGEAVRYVLIRTGYQLAAEDSIDPRVKAVFALRLPDNQRTLGPFRVDAMLGVLMGQPYRLVTDPSARTVTYTAAPAGVEAAASAPASATPARSARAVSLAQSRTY